jgi:hypothetical protein
MEWWNSETAVLQPDFYAVAEADIVALGETMPIDPQLRAFWQDHGYGFFSTWRDGGMVDPSIANRLVHPSDIPDIMEYLDVNLPELSSFGIPFFNRLDLEHLFVDAAGQIVSDRACAPGPKLICKDLREFVGRLMQDPLFYEEIID